jgi:hypothetical protein
MCDSTEFDVCLEGLIAADRGHRFNQEEGGQTRHDAK